MEYKDEKRFVRCTETEYISISTPDANGEIKLQEGTFYFIEDKKELYLGTNCLTDAVIVLDSIDNIPSVDKIVKGRFYVDSNGGVASYINDTWIKFVDPKVKAVNYVDDASVQPPDAKEGSLYFDGQHLGIVKGASYIDLMDMKINTCSFVADAKKAPKDMIEGHFYMDGQGNLGAAVKLTPDAPALSYIVLIEPSTASVTMSKLTEVVDATKTELLAKIEAKVKEVADKIDPIEEKFDGEKAKVALVAESLKDFDKDKYVLKEDGKGLSEVDFTAGDKTKLDELKNYELPIASADKLGGIKIGAGLTVEADGKVNATGVSVDLSPYAKIVDSDAKYVAKDGYVAYSQEEKDKLKDLKNFELEPAATDKLGGVKVGTGLSIEVDGTLTATGVSVDLSPYMKKTDADNKFVTKETDKGLSKNDYTDADKAKLAGLENYVLPVAAADKLGGIKIGSGLAIDSDGVVTAAGGGGTPYVLPKASNTELGGIKVGTGLAIDGNGILSASGVAADLTPYLKKTDADDKFVAKVAGKDLSSNDYTTEEKTKLAGLSKYELPAATATDLGGVIVENNSGLNIDTDGKLTVNNEKLKGEFLTKSDAASTYETKASVAATYVKKADADTTYLKTVPIASNTVLGGIKVGTGLTVEADGTLKATGVSVDLSPYAKTVDSDAKYVAKAGYVAYSQEEKDKLKGLKNFELKNASPTELGGVKVGEGLTIDTNGVLKAEVLSSALSNYYTSAQVNDGFVAKAGYVAYSQEEKDKLKDLKNFILEPAAADKLGGIKVGTGLTVEADGTLKATATPVDLAPYLKSKDADIKFATKEDLNGKANNATVAAKLDKTEAASTYVAKNGSKQLSDENFTNAEKTKLAGLENYVLPVAAADKLGGIKINTGNNDNALKISNNPGQEGELSVQSAGLNTLGVVKTTHDCGLLCDAGVGNIRIDPDKIPTIKDIKKFEFKIENSGGHKVIKLTILGTTQQIELT